MKIVSSVSANADPSLWTKVDHEGVARANHHAKEDCEISFVKGEELIVLSQTADWYRVVVKKSGLKGLCPTSFVQIHAHVQSERNSHKDLLSMLDNMFEETVAADAEGKQEDEEALAAAAALEAEFSFDNIMLEVMAMKEETPKKPLPLPLATKSKAVDLSTRSGLSSSAEDDDDFNGEVDDDVVPQKALPPLPPTDPPVPVDDEMSSPLPISVVPLVALNSTSPRSVRRNLTPPSTASVASVATAAPPGGRRSGAVGGTRSPVAALPPTLVGSNGSVGSVSPVVSRNNPTGAGVGSVSPLVSRNNSSPSTPSVGRAVVKLAGEDGQIRCPKCSTVIGKDATFCKHCGSTLKQVVAEQCSKCKVTVKPGAIECAGCGTRVSGLSKVSGSAVSSPTAVGVSLPPQGSLSSLSKSNNGISVILSPRRSATPVSPRRSQQTAGSGNSPRKADLPPTPVRSHGGSGIGSGLVSPRKSHQFPTVASAPVAVTATSTAAVSLPAAPSAARSGDGKTRVIMVGSGSSSGTPSLDCLANSRCKACVDSLQPGSKNRRRNPSLLIQHKGSNILIDCGKSFRESWIDVIERYQITTIDAVIISHAHADAFFGLDDLREVIPKNKMLPVYARESDQTILAMTFPYLLPANKGNIRFTSNLTFHLIPNQGPFEVCGLKFRGIPLPHGPDFTSLGFQFGPVVYFSDVSFVPDRVFEFLSLLPVFKVFIVDALFVKTECKTHLNLPQALAVIQQAKPERAILTGCSHEFFYPDVRRVLKKVCVKEGIRVKLGYDTLGFSLESELFE